MNIKTIILRFRDLITADKQTISMHQEIINQKGYVWWGWWKKGEEKTPLQEFSYLGTKARESFIIIFLVDSGQNLVYKAQCIDIVCQQNQKMPSPDKEATPGYYCEQDYYAWFKIESIEECNEQELKQFSYVNCNDLFIDENINYKNFENKKIFSSQELIQQNRTVWFVREAHNDDLDYEIILLNSDIIQPTHFSNNFYQATGNVIVWLSDLHLPDKVFEERKGKQQQTLAQHIRSLTDKENIGGWIISGDITSRAESEGFKKAQTLLQDLGIKTSQNILICPGNHDFKRESTLLSENEEPAFIYDKIQNTTDYSEFYSSIYKLKPNEFYAAGKKIMLSTGQLVELVALNSVILQQYENFEGHGYLSQEQLDYVAEEMGWNKEENKNSIRIAVMHHHYLPTCFTERIETTKASSVVYDADRLMKWLVKYNVRLLLHGHKHNTFFAQVRYPKKQCEQITNEDFAQVTVIGMGGTGAKNADNKFGLLKFSQNQVVVEFYKLNSDGSQSDVKCQTLTLFL